MPKIKHTRAKPIQRLLMMAALAVSPLAQAATITLNGQTYTILTFTGTYNTNSSYFNTTYMPWWGNTTYARNAAVSLGTQLGQPNGGFSPYFAGQLVSSNTQVDNYYTNSAGTTAYDGYYALTASGVYAYVYVAPTGPSAVNTLASVQQNASSLAATYNTNAAALQTGLTYDCNTFDENGLCASAGGRLTYAGSSSFSNQQSGLVIVSHKPSPYFRFGGYADQSVATATPTGIKQSNSGPMYGFFGYWNNQKDGMGLGASVTTSFSNNNLTISRSNALANTEAGSGATQMSGQGIQAQTTYALQATDRIKAIPYLGVRYYRVATGAYTEGSSTDVTSPLSYNAMSQEVFAAVGGVGTSVFLAEKLTGTASVGLQQNMNYKMGNYQGTSAISGLSNFSVQMPSNTNSMATATAGLNYAIKKNEKLGVNVLWQQQAFTDVNP